MVEAFLSRFGLRAIKVGSPVLSILEASAQSDLRSSEDIFSLLSAIALDQAKGLALDRIGADESLARQSESPASGKVTVGDSSFEKVSTKVFQGTPAPIVGSVNINVVSADAAVWPASGSIYIGRNTPNYEGPLAYTSILPPGIGFGFSGGNYYTIVLSSGTLRFHNLGETVILAQGGDRAVNAGQVVQTPQGNATTAVQYKVLYAATLPDGEVSIEGVQVVALKPGTLGNVIAGSITSFSSAPFTGATVNNPTPFTNGLATENDDSYRERIRAARQSRTKGTPLALQTFAVGVTSVEENKRVLSASVVQRTGQLTTVYVDDGTGYEENAEGIAIESFIDLATGGEDYFKISADRPVTKAYVLTEETAPYTLSAGQQLAFSIGGVTTVHTFDADEFRSIGNATAFEVVASINSNFELDWSARTNASGTKVAVFSKSDTNESIQNIVIDDVDGEIVDANVYLGFPSGRVDTMRLYKNDRLLTKDGSIASITSNPFSQWAGFSSTETLALEVDGTPLDNLVGGVYTFTAQDFINAKTGYTSVGINTVEAWVAVFNLKIPGITATAVNGLVVLTSNRDYSSAASLNITGGTLVNHGMFDLTPEVIQGADSDYVLDRNTGELRLAEPLAEDDRLGAGSTNTRAFLETDPFTVVNVTTDDAKFWFVGDGQATLIEHALTASNPMTASDTVEAWGERQRLTGTADTFTNVLKGDWVIFWDSTSPAELLNRAFRVAALDQSTFSWIEFDIDTVVTPGVYTFANGGVSVVRTEAQLQEVTVPVANNYTAAGVVPVINDDLTGIEASVYRTTALRVKTLTFNEDTGDIALVAANTQAQLFGVPIADYIANLTGHQAHVESGRSDTGTPDFHQTYVTATITDGFTAPWDQTLDLAFTSPEADSMVVGLLPYLEDGYDTDDTRYGQTHGFVTTVSDVVYNSGTVPTTVWDITTREQPSFWLPDNRFYLASPFRFTSDDLLAILVDGDVNSKRFVVPMWRTLTSVGTTYGATNEFTDADNGGQSLAIGFGYTGGPVDPFAFEDFAVYMAARTKTHAEGDLFSSIAGGAYDINYNSPAAQPDASRTVLWRYRKLGPDGNTARVKYALPDAPDSDVAVAVDSFSDAYTDISVILKSGALKTGYTLSSSYPVGTVAVSTTSGLTKVYYILAFKVTSISCTSNVVSFTLDLPSDVQHTGLDLTETIPYYYVASSGTLSTQDVYLSTEQTSGGNYKIVKSNITHANFAAESNTGVLYLAGSVTASLAGASPAVAQGDFFRVESTANLPDEFEGFTVRVQNDVVADPYTIQAVVEDFTGSTSDTFTYNVIGDASAFRLFINSSQTAADIVSAVQVLYDADTRVPVYGTLIGDGTGIIDRSSAEDAAVSPTWYLCQDGINYVKTTTPPGSPSGNYQLLFKNDITASLATDSDWGNEVVKLVPRTTKNLVDWLNAPTVSGLFSVAEVSRSTRARKIQIASFTPGSEGSVQVQGGTANTTTAAVRGSAAIVGDQMVVSTLATDAASLQGLQWCAVDNTNTMPKSIFSSATVLDSIINDTSTTSLLTYDAGTDVYTTIVSQGNRIVTIERQGDFIAIYSTGLVAGLNLTGTTEACFVRITAPDSEIYVGQPGYGMVESVNNGNTGIFRIVRYTTLTDQDVVWIENAAAVPQDLAEIDIKVFSADSVIPGDFLHISTSLWDGSSSNKGIFEVTDVGNAGSGSYLNSHKLTVRATLSTVGSPTAVLGSEVQRVQVLEGIPGRYIKQVLAIAPNQDDGDLADVKFTTNGGASKIGATAGSIVSAMDKLDFPTSISKGVDGYQHSIGLIAEVNRVIYGDPADPATYPGVAAAGASVNISGPLVKRIQVTLSLRIRTGATRQDIEDRVKSAVASIINKTGIGQPIALSSLTNAATKVGGVISAVMVSPLATAGNDLISVQPYEKALVLNVDQDVLISFAGG